MRFQLAAIATTLLLQSLPAQLHVTTTDLGLGMSCYPCGYSIPTLGADAVFCGSTSQTLCFGAVSTDYLGNTAVYFSVPTSSVPFPDLGIPGWSLPVGCPVYASNPFAIAMAPLNFTLPNVAPFDVVVQGITFRFDLGPCFLSVPFLYVTNAVRIAVQ